MRGASAEKSIENKALHSNPAQVAPGIPLDCTPRLWLRCAAAGLQAQAAIHPSQENTMTTANPRLTDHPEEAAVRVPLELYMRGHAEDNSAHMRAAFMPTARIESVREGPLTSWDIDTYCARFKGQPAADEATRRRSIDAIDIGGTAASAKITLVHGAITFIDYFVLLKTEAGWKIANKAFHAQPH